MVTTPGKRNLAADSGTPRSNKRRRRVNRRVDDGSDEEERPAKERGAGKASRNGGAAETEGKKVAAEDSESDTEFSSAVCEAERLEMRSAVLIPRRYVGQPVSPLRAAGPCIRQPGYSWSAYPCTQCVGLGKRCQRQKEPVFRKHDGAAREATGTCCFLCRAARRKCELRMSRDRGKGQKDQTMTESVETKVEERSDGMGPHVTEQLIDKTSLQRVETEDGVAMKVRFEHLERGVDTFHEVTRIFEDDNLVDVLERTVLHATQSLDGNDRSESPVGGLKEGQDDMVDTVDTDSPRYAGDSLEVANSFNKDIDIGTDQVDSGSCDYELDASDGQGLVSVLKGILDELKEIRRNTDNILKCKEITLQEVRALEGILSVCGGAGKLQGTGNVGGSTIGPVGHRRTASTDTLVDLMNGKA